MAIRTRKFDRKIHYCCRDSFLLKKIYKRDAPFRVVFKVKTLAILFPPYPLEMKTNTPKFKSAAILIDCSKSPTVRSQKSIVEADGPPSWSLGACETGESIKYHAFNPISPTNGHFVLSPVSRASTDQDGGPVGLSDPHL